MGDPGANSPINGDESPRHLLFKKWYRQEVWVDPALVQESDVLSEEPASPVHAAAQPSVPLPSSHFGPEMPRPPLSEVLAHIEHETTRTFKLVAGTIALGVLGCLARMQRLNAEADRMCNLSIMMVRACLPKNRSHCLV